MASEVREELREGAARKPREETTGGKGRLGQPAPGNVLTGRGKTTEC